MRSFTRPERGGVATWVVLLLAVVAGLAIAFPLVMTGRQQAEGAKQAIGQIDAASEALAQARLQQAMRAAQIHFAENGSYEGFGPDVAAQMDPSVRYDTSQTASDGVISIRGVTATSVVFATAVRGGALCTAAVFDQVSFGRVDAASADACRGGW